VKFVAYAKQNKIASDNELTEAESGRGIVSRPHNLYSQYV
jgi:hypothetical protein